MGDDLKQKVERWAGDTFVGWYNDSHGTNFQFRCHQDPPSPDLLYVDGDDELQIEATGTHYGQDGAQFEAMNARGLPNAPDGWSSMKASGAIVSIDAAFTEFLQERLSEKAGKSYATAPILVIHHTSRLLGSDGVSRLVSQVAIPDEHPFSAIYLLADLPDGDPEGKVLVRQLPTGLPAR